VQVLKDAINDIKNILDAKEVEYSRTRMQLRELEQIRTRQSNRPAKLLSENEYKNICNCLNRAMELLQSATTPELEEVLKQAAAILDNYYLQARELERLKIRATLLCYGQLTDASRVASLSDKCSADAQALINGFICAYWSNKAAEARKNTRDTLEA
jgi:DNA repair ATPase RecN